jgi:hypothetical protein
MEGYLIQLIAFYITKTTDRLRASWVTSLASSIRPKLYKFSGQKKPFNAGPCIPVEP